MNPCFLPRPNTDASNRKHGAAVSAVGEQGVAVLDQIEAPLLLLVALEHDLVLERSLILPLSLSKRVAHLGHDLRRLALIASNQLLIVTDAHGPVVTPVLEMTGHKRPYCSLSHNSRDRLALGPENQVLLLHEG